MNVHKVNAHGTSINDQSTVLDTQPTTKPLA